jgi:signal peptidase I
LKLRRADEKERGEWPLSNRDLTDILAGVAKRGACVRFQAKGFSMSPFIRDGDVVTLSPLKGYLPRLGDTVAFISPATESLLIHRVIGKRGGSTLILKGDNLPINDGLVPVMNIVAYVLRVERKGKEASFGLGPERVLIALLNRMRLLPPLLLVLRKASACMKKGAVR